MVLSVGIKSRSRKGDPGAGIRCFKEVGRECDTADADERGEGNTEGLTAMVTEGKDGEERQGEDSSKERMFGNVARKPRVLCVH